MVRCKIVNCTLWREADFKVKMLKTPRSLTAWKLRCRKSARSCGAKHICNSKGAKHTILGAFLEVEMLKIRRCGAKHTCNPKGTKHTIPGALLEVELLKSARGCGAKHVCKST